MHLPELLWDFEEIGLSSGGAVRSASRDWSPKNFGGCESTEMVV